MNDQLYRHYEHELLFIRQMSQRFARRYPATAGRLLLDAGGSSDPHVERLLEGFAFLAGRVQQKLDDEFPELTDALLGILYPHYLAPIPSLTVVQLEPDPTNPQPKGLEIPRESRLHSQRYGDTQCDFRTCYPVRLWPLRITRATLQPLPLPVHYVPPPDCEAALRLELACHGNLPFSALKSLDVLRLHLTGSTESVPWLYELLLNNALRVEFRSLSNPDSPPVTLDPGACLRPVGFGRDEGLLPYPQHSFPGYRLLTELFSFPEKFHFVDLCGWERVVASGFGNRVEVVVYLNRTRPDLERALGPAFFRLGCTPAVNLFSRAAEPIPLTHTRTEYRVVADVHRQRETEIYSIDQVRSVAPADVRVFRPFYSFRHESDWHADDRASAYWYAVRRPSSQENDTGTEVFLNVVDADFDPRTYPDTTLVVRATCTNRDLPMRLQQAGESLQFVLESAVPLNAVRVLRPATPPRYPALQQHAQWQLISHLALNHLSISDPQDGLRALQQMLRLYEFSDASDAMQRAAVNRQLIEGMIALDSRRVVGRTGGPVAGGFCRGVEVTIEFDAQKYIGTGLFLFASVLEHFFGLYASINSFTQLVAKTGDGGLLRKWAPRAGEEPLL